MNFGLFLMFQRLIACDDLVRVVAEFLPRKVCQTISEVEDWLDSGFPYKKIVFVGEHTTLNDWLRLFSSKSLKLRRLKELAFRLRTDEERCLRIVQALSNDRFIHLKRLVISAEFKPLNKIPRCFEKQGFRPDLALDLTFQVGDISTVAELIDSRQARIESNLLVVPSKTNQTRQLTTTLSRKVFRYHSCSTRSSSLVLNLQQSSFALQCLNLRHSNIRDEDTVALSRILQDSNRRLIQLELQGNAITGAGAATLAKALRYNRDLKKLRLDRNRLGPSGGAAMADALLQNRSLLELHLQFNCLGERGRNAISSALQENCSIRTCFYYD